MTDSKRVTREGLAAATMAVEEEDERLGVVGRGRMVDRIFDALPEPPPSEDVDAGWEGHDRGHLRLAQVPAFLRSVIASGERIHKADVDDIEAAIRAEAGTLDVERLARAMPCEDPEEPCDADGRDEHRWCDYCIARSVVRRRDIAAEYARLTEADR